MEAFDEMKLAKQLIAGSVLTAGLAGAFDEGHFLSWLTLPVIAAYSLAMNRNINRAVFATFSMVFAHEGLWYFFGNLIVLVALGNLFTVAHLMTFLVFPVTLTSIYLWKYRPYAKLLLGFLPYMMVWDALGFPISTRPRTIPFQYLSTDLEIISWGLICAIYLVFEYNSTWRSFWKGWLLWTYPSSS